jgi:arylsulfatase
MGYPRDTSPFLDSLARESLVFPNAVATASYSLASVATILSGLSPFHHRVVQREDRLTDDVETIAEHFQAHGYATLGLSANGYHSPQFGSDQGYEQFLMMWRVCNGSPECTSDPHQAVRAVLDTLEGGFADDRPLFLLLHVVPPHSPYDPPPVFDVFTDPDYEGPASGDVDYLHRVIDGRETPSDRDVEHLVALYDGNIRRLDDAVERLLQGLSEVRDRQRETAVVFIADHGEAFGDHGWFGHSGTVYDEMVRVPFILRLPDVRDAGPVDTTQLASLEDVLPTLLDVAGLPPPTRCDGVDLLAPSSKASRDARVVLMRNALDDRLELGVRSRRWKAVVRGTEKRQLFDLSADPRENHNLAGDRRELLGGFEALLAASFTWGNHAGVPILPDAEANALRALGYVDHD